MKKLILFGMIATLIAFNAIIVFDKDNNISLFSLKSAAALTQEQIEKRPDSKLVKEEVYRTDIVKTYYTCAHYVYFIGYGWKESGSSSCVEQRTISTHLCKGIGTTLWCYEFTETLSAPDYYDLCENAYRLAEDMWNKYECKKN
jgi:hypothetical protein